jgi:TetR/AcrR family transcriptional repressor of nem operon
MARPLEFNPDEALNQALDIFWKKGYDATSLSDLLDAMKLSKSSFYQSFGNKHQLYEQCLQHYRYSISRNMLRDLETAPSALSFIKKLFSSIAKDVSEDKGRCGCMIMNSASAKAPFDEKIGDIVHDGAKQFEDIFYKAVKRAQAKGDIPKDKNPKTLARFLVSSRSGLLAMAKAGASKEELKDIITVTLSVLK